MEQRVAELAAMRAPNTSGVNTAAVLKALAGNPDLVRTPPTYAYGMNVEDAQREGQLGAQNQQQREASLRDTRNTAIAQDQQSFDIAMKAHAQYMAERNQAVQERVAAAEIALKQARMAGIPAEIEARKLANAKLLHEIEYEKQLDDLKITLPDAANPGQTIQLPARVVMSTGGKNLAQFLSGVNPNETASERAAREKTRIYIERGLSPNGAYLMGNTNLGQTTFSLMNKAAEAQLKNEEPKYGQPSYGTKGTDKDGKPIPKTREDRKLEILNGMVDSYFPMLPTEDREVIKSWGFGAAGMFQSNTPPAASTEEQPLLTPEELSTITRALGEAYK